MMSRQEAAETIGDTTKGLRKIVERSRAKANGVRTRCATIVSLDMLTVVVPQGDHPLPLGLVRATPLPEEIALLCVPYLAATEFFSHNTANP